MPDPLNDAIASLDDLRELDPLGNAEKYPDELVLEARDAVIEALEKACNVSFVRRSYTQAFADAVPLRQLALDRTRDPVITAATDAYGNAYTESQLAALRVGRGGLISRVGSLSFHHGATLTYEQGYAVCPGRVARAVRLLTRDWLVENVNEALPSRATSWSAGDNTYRLVTAGVAGAIFDLPEANAVVKQFRE